MPLLYYAGRNTQHINHRYEGYSVYAAYLQQIKHITRQYLDATETISIRNHQAEHLYEYGHLTVDELAEAERRFAIADKRTDSFQDEIFEVAEDIDTFAVTYPEILEAKPFF